ncbi:MAG: hypothetical protein KKD00_00285, partial [Gammaproteobacteria bacterium]|nr:hypothetical protein [Gammaproteobacteria bacterium]
MTAPKPSAQTLDQHSASLFSELVSVCGIQDRFINFSGTTEVINQQELSAILHAQGIDVSS